MANTFFGLTIAKSGLYAANSGMNTTAHNISNAETEGYSRQVISSQASKALYVGNTSGMVGTGTDITGIDQIRSEYYDVKYRTNNTLYGEYNTKNYYLQELQNYFNEVQLEGFTTTFDNLNVMLQEMQKDPSNLTVRTQLNNYASAYSEYFNYVYSSVQNIQSEINYEIENQVTKINSIGSQVAQLTKQINSLEVIGGTASDLRDQRALLVDELSEIVDVTVEEVPVGQAVGINSYIVRINGQLLVDTYHANELLCVPRTSKNSVNDADGLSDVVWKQDNQEFNLSGANSGTLKSLYAVMDGNDNMAFKGMATAAKGEKKATVVSDFDYVNDLSRLNIDTQGTITIGNRDYSYNGFSVSINDEGKYVYEFALDEEIKVDTNDVTPSVENSTGYTYNTIIGEDVDFKGVTYYLSRLNEFVRTFAKSYNDITKSGVDLAGNAGLDYFNGSSKVTGENYQFVENWEKYGNENVLFTSKTGEYYIEGDVENYGSYYFLTAGNLTVTKEILDDPKRVVAASSIANGVENSDIASKLMGLKNDAGMFKQGAPASYLQALVSEVGIDCAKAEQFAKNQEDVIQSISNQRLSVSGVDQDEEAMNLVRYQNAYNLNAKVISIMNEIYDKMINQMGV